MAGEKVDKLDATSATTVAEKESTSGVTLQRSTNLPISQQSTILAHRIQKKCKTVAMALELMKPHTSSARSADWEDAWFATLQLCGKHRDYQQAVRIVQDYIPNSDQCRSLAISICGRCQQIEEALKLVDKSDAASHISTPAPFNAAIAACGTNRAWKEALRMVQEEMPKRFVSSLTCNAVLTALAKSQLGDEALQFLGQGFDQLQVQRDRISYHHTVYALLAQGDRLEQAVQLVLKDMREEAQTRPEVTPNQETYDRLIAAVVAKRNVVDDKDHYNTLLEQLQQASQEAPAAIPKKKKRKRTDTADSAATKRSKLNPNTVKNILPWDFEKWELPKRGKGKTACWELGVIEGEDESIVVGLHPNRNPSKNGIQLWFFRENGEKKRPKLGYLLMINTPGDAPSSSGTSQFLGLRVTDEARRNGLAKTFVAIWLQCCLDANLQPTTGKMNKPLLCLVLQHTYGFTPLEGGVRAKMLPPSSGSNVVRLTTESNAVKNLAGALTPRDVQEQKVQFVAPTEANGAGRPIDVGGLLQAPVKEEMLRRIQPVLQDRWKLLSGIHRAEDARAEETSDRPLTMSRLFLGV